MKAAHDHRQTGGAELAAEIERARELVGLNADQANKAGARGADARDRAFDVDNRVGLIIGFDRDVDVGAEHLVGGAVGEQPIQARQAGRRYHRAPPLDDVAVGVVVRRLDQHNPEGTPCHPRLAPAVCVRTTNQRLKAHAKSTDQPEAEFAICSPACQADGPFRAKPVSSRRPSWRGARRRPWG
jgi:hypothetical protein